MMNSIRMTLAVTALVACAAVSFGQKKTTAENRLIGIKLYDTGLRVIQVYGTPDDIQPIGFGGGAIGSSGVGGRGPGGGPGGTADPVGSTRAPDGGVLGMGKDYSFENDVLLRQKGPPAVGAQGGNSAILDGPAPGSGGGGIGGAGGGAMGGGGSGNRITFTRWIYKRGGSRYGFIIDNQNRVVQIEAIGLQNRKVRTRKGVGFGATFADLIKRYQKPDAYEISGEQIVVRFLNRHRVAFRLSRLGVDKPHVVTGVVVAAGRG